MNNQPTIFQKLNELGQRKVPESFLLIAQFFIVIVFAYLGFEFGREPVFSYDDFIKTDFNLFWFFTFNSFFGAIASGWSAFLAAYAFQIHGVEEVVTKIERVHDASRNIDIETHSKIGNPYGYGGISLPEKVQQFLLNFSGGLVGWVVIYFLIIKVNWFSNFAGWEKLIMIALIFFSITGYLPYILIRGGLPWSK